MVALSFFAIDTVALGTAIGPLHYRSAADSPFDLSRLGIDFFLDDFSQAVELPSPGVPATIHLLTAKMTTPGVSETTGSAVPNLELQELVAPRAFLDPETHARVAEMSFSFDAGILGKLPQAVGFQVFGGPTIANFYSVDGNIVETELIPGPTILTLPAGGVLYIEPNDQSNTDCCFWGATYPDGISRVTLTSQAFVLFLDDFQYGQLTPEPSALLLAICGAMGVAALFGWKTPSTNNKTSRPSAHPCAGGW